MYSQWNWKVKKQLLFCPSDSQDSGSLCFCFRWLLIWFKREFSFEDILILWEVSTHYLELSFNDNLCHLTSKLFWVVNDWKRSMSLWAKGGAVCHRGEEKLNGNMWDPERNLSPLINQSVCQSVVDWLSIPPVAADSVNAVNQCDCDSKIVPLLWMFCVFLLLFHIMYQCPYVVKSGFCLLCWRRWVFKWLRHKDALHFLTPSSLFVFLRSSGLVCPVTTSTCWSPAPSWCPRGASWSAQTTTSTPFWRCAGEESSWCVKTCWSVEDFVFLMKRQMYFWSAAHQWLDDEAGPADGSVWSWVRLSTAGSVQGNLIEGRIHGWHLTSVKTRSCRI